MHLTATILTLVHHVEGNMYYRDLLGRGDGFWIQPLLFEKDHSTMPNYKGISTHFVCPSFESIAPKRTNAGMLRKT